MQTRGEGVSGVHEAELETLDAPETDAPDVEENGHADESPRENTERIFRELKERGTAEGDGDKDEPVDLAIKDRAEKPKGSQKVADPDLELDPELSPPERFNARAKELFNNLPKGVRRELNRTVKNLESLTTREREELKRASQEVQSIRDAVQPFATSWAQRGRSVPQAVAELAAAQDRLTNPQTKLQAYLELGHDIGVDITPLLNAVTGGRAGQQQAPVHIPQLAHLQQQVESLTSEREAQRQRNLDALSQQMTAEFKAVQHEKDQAGRYRWPELHDEGFLGSVKPLVSALLSSDPSLSHAEALKRAVIARRGQVGAPAAAHQASLPAATAQQRAQAAASSVRGTRVSGVSSAGSGDEPPDNLDPREITAWSLDRLRRGFING